MGVFKRVEPVTFSAEDWKPLVGRTQPRTGDDLAHRAQGRQGDAWGQSLGNHPIEPSFADCFSTAPAFRRVLRNGDGTVTGFVFHDLVFERQ